MSRKKPTQCYDNINKVSQIDWGFFPDVEDKITRNQEKQWKLFIQWISTLNITTIRDFEPKGWRWKISEDKMFLRVENSDETTWYKQNSRGSWKYNKISSVEINTLDKMIGIVGRLTGNQLRISGAQGNLETLSEGNENNNIQENEDDSRYPEEIEEAILNKRAVAAVDASVDERYMAISWVVTTLENEPRCVNQVESSNWI